MSNFAFCNLHFAFCTLSAFRFPLSAFPQSAARIGRPIRVGRRGAGAGGARSCGPAGWQAGPRARRGAAGGAAPGRRQRGSLGGRPAGRSRRLPRKCPSPAPGSKAAPVGGGPTGASAVAKPSARKGPRTTPRRVACSHGAKRWVSMLPTCLPAAASPQPRPLSRSGRGRYWNVRLALQAALQSHGPAAAAEELLGHLADQLLENQLHRVAPGRRVFQGLSGLEFRGRRRRRDRLGRLPGGLVPSQGDGGPEPRGQFRPGKRLQLADPVDAERMEQLDHLRRQAQGLDGQRAQGGEGRREERGERMKDEG